MKNLKLREWCILAAASCLIVISPAGNVFAEKKIEVKFCHTVTNQTPKGQAALKFKEILEKSGIFDVKIYPTSQLYGDKEELEALRANNVQVIGPSITKLVGFNPQFQIIDLPFLFKSTEAAEKFWKSEKGQAIFNSLRPKGFIGIGYWPNGFTHFINNKRPLTKPADFKGLKFRIQSGGLQDTRNRLLGAGSQTIASAEVYQALQTGTIDGLDNTFSTHQTLKFYEVAKYLTIGNIARIDYIMLTNVKFWGSLTQQQKDIFMDAMNQASAIERKLSDEMNENSLEIMKKSGHIETYTLSDAEKQEFVKVLQPLYKQFENRIGKENIDYAVSLQ